MWVKSATCGGEEMRVSQIPYINVGEVGDLWGKDMRDSNWWGRFIIVIIRDSLSLIRCHSILLNEMYRCLFYSNRC
jgi:hypothetical protein